MTDRETISAIDNPQKEDANAFLAQLGLDALPSAEQLRSELEDELLKPKCNFISQRVDQYQIHWEQSLDIQDLFSLEPSSSPLKLSYKRAGLDGRVIGVTETRVSKTLSALNSTSMQRAAAPPGSFVRGKSGHVPFWPGGLDEALGLDEDAVNRNGTSGLQTIPPGFTRGLRLPGEVDEAELINQVADHITSEPKLYETDVPVTRPPPEHSEIDELLPLSRVQVSGTTVPKQQKRSLPQRRDWAHVVDVNKPMPQARFKQLVPEMAHNYPFELDTFQKEAVYHLEQGDSVFVAAHTSAGKTVVAEYAIALAAKHMTRAIYTSPIKALSNQKFRDFKTTFSASSVGILTGDVQINPEANCLIMTTEILRSMLYKGADLIRDVEFVIFDEVHYVNDAERGVVWEEVIIMLPDHVNIILLSATVPNTKEFADWVGRTKKKDIYVISTPKRPVPLEHFLYAGKETFKIVDAKGSFLSSGYKEAGEALRRKQDKEREAAGLPPVQRLGARAAAPQRGQRGGGPGRGAATRGGGVVKTGPMGGARTFHSADKNLYVHLLNHLRKKELLPVVVFTFSKKRCEENAATLTNADLCTSVEKSEVHVAVEKALSRLKGTDKQLPQIGRMRDLLSRGIGVHHGGLLPIVKEVVEILFARGLVKILFATETFAMGVNMPARCVVFSGIRKHDGKSFRELLAGEYTQMSGRAGRRGLDSTGVVVIVAGDELPEMATLNKMMLGTPSRLQSQFRLTYNMILNLLRVEALKVEEMIKRSFSENASQRLLPDQQKKIIEIEAKLKKLPDLQCDVCTPDIQVVYDLSKEIIWRHQDLLSTAASQPAGTKLFAPGRIVILRDGHFSGNIAVLLKKAPLASVAQDGGQKLAPYFVLALIDPETKQKAHEKQSIPPIWDIKPETLMQEERAYDVCIVPISSILRVTNRVIKPDIDMILERQRISVMREIVEQLQEIATEWHNASPPRIPEVEWSKMRQLEFQENLRSREALEKRLEGKGCTLCEHFNEHYGQIHERKQLLAEIESLKFALSDQNLELLPDYEQRIAVLKDLKFIDDNSTVQLKGRVACEINSADELILTELILENTFADYELEEVAALLSCFVFQEKSEVEPVLTPTLAKGREEILVVADRVGRIQDYHKVSAEDFEKKLKFGLVEVVYEWAKGTTFEDITKLTDVAEGTIVRVITRLDETFREVRDAARVIGDAELFKKMEEAQTKIKRDSEYIIGHPTIY
ncbi:DExH-box ATP-dependent RNA helicase DExH11 {ECO:0000305}; AltName: Full=AtHELPS {ECO:0000303/PubMed:21535471}; AltName: Full=Protein SKI2 homolog {ECO:0000303/PubMed:22511887}; Short=AtSKI2 {ECO:0000303/PubMed:22511887} [Serendipita indica DSM 11827]|nr:DExH-box ATP-dependent RNA helicase DExH11 {ECO:0000305}; AltName: Full=AtHELPS {ECO:0000303/PubMed:21535471}; AltName: Full=Protein SKI2 homolog {ECO:0000303/PubMed:22511887}; Short=AtSKI2 {ECO:0000303/PubMed:22511887} [Serendipita indica DSM 11827]